MARRLTSTNRVTRVATRSKIVAYLLAGARFDHHSEYQGDRRQRRYMAHLQHKKSHMHNRARTRTLHEFFNDYMDGFVPSPRVVS